MLNKGDVQNKMLTGKEIKNKAITESYFFPEHGITVEASSMEEAEKKLQVTLSKK